MLTKVESWWALAGLVMGTGLFGWLGQQWDTLASLGWAAVLIVAVLISSLVMIAVSAAYVALVHFRKKAEPTSPVAARPRAEGESAQMDVQKAPRAVDNLPRFTVNGLYVGGINIDTRNIESELVVEIIVNGFNATGSVVSINDPRGNISYCQSGADNECIALPTPRLCRDRTNTEVIANFSEIFIVLEQRLPRTVASTIMNDLSGERVILLDLEHLNLVVCDGSKKFAERLPLWGGVVVRKRRDAIVTGKWIRGSVQLTLGGATQPN